jgi:hypothetical protein
MKYFPICLWLLSAQRRHLHFYYFMKIVSIIEECQCISYCLKLDMISCYINILILMYKIMKHPKESRRIIALLQQALRYGKSDWSTKKGQTKKIPWPLARKLTIPTERPPLLVKFTANFWGSRGVKQRKDKGIKPASAIGDSKYKTLFKIKYFVRGKR